MTGERLAQIGKTVSDLATVPDPESWSDTLSGMLLDLWAEYGRALAKIDLERCAADVRLGDARNREDHAVIICDADTPPIENGLIFIGYCELVDGYRHAYRTKVRGRTVVRYSRSASHPADDACPECHPIPTALDGA